MEDCVPYMVEIQALLTAANPYLHQLQSCGLVLCFGFGIVSGAVLGDFR